MKMQHQNSWIKNLFKKLSFKGSKTEEKVYYKNKINLEHSFHRSYFWWFVRCLLLLALCSFSYQLMMIEMLSEQNELTNLDACSRERCSLIFGKWSAIADLNDQQRHLYAYCPAWKYRIRTQGPWLSSTTIFDQYRFCVKLLFINLFINYRAQYTHNIRMILHNNVYKSQIF